MVYYICFECNISKLKVAKKVLKRENSRAFDS